MITVVDVMAQWVRTSWTKRSRGGPAASARNAAPVGFPWPVPGRGGVHDVVMDEAHDFEPRESFRGGLPDRGDVLVDERGGRLRVQLVVTPFGLPRRWRRPPAVYLGPGEWVRWQVNYRFVGSGGGDWTYGLDTLNLGCGLGAFTGRPSRFVDERASLR
jgi:hypothetical protein